MTALHALVSDEDIYDQMAGDTRRAIRLAGDFHLQIAQHAGHQTLGRILRAQVSRTSLVLMTYSLADTRTPAPGCACSEHRALLDAIRVRDVPEASSRMHEHLAQLESQLQFRPAQEPAPDLATMFSAEV
jgi:DNA-binding GntR family transcriptional regulator